MDYTMHLKKSSYESIENTSLFSFFQENSNFSNFSHGVHATLTYYKEKTPHIHIVEENTSRKPCPTMTEEELCITTSESGFTVTINNLLFKNKNIIYIPHNEGVFDVERTWKIIQEKRDFSKIKKIYFVMEEWSKLVYAYRFATSYGIAVEDITYPS